jgi:hypothetical protein
MRPRLGIAIGGAALTGVVGASLASWQAGAPIAVRLIVPAGSVGGNILGSPNSAAPAPGLGAGWLLLRTLPDHTAPAPAAPAAAALVAVAPAPAAPSAPGSSIAPIPAVLASFPVHLSAPLHGLPRLPMPVSLPLVSLKPPAGTHRPAPGRLGGHGHHNGGSGQVAQSHPSQDLQSGQD